jgi:hypothetical protein
MVVGSPNVVLQPKVEEDSHLVVLCFWKVLNKI